MLYLSQSQHGAVRVSSPTLSFDFTGYPVNSYDRDPRFTAEFWQSVFRSLGERLKMSTSDHLFMDGQTERVSRVRE
uniref:Uncharacterized protein n=1 Tax=Peronospora matthiolae TaxID=2874970 RepID=A0AAV1TLK3_9STRA